MLLDPCAKVMRQPSRRNLPEDVRSMEGLDLMLHSTRRCIAIGLLIGQLPRPQAKGEYAKHWREDGERTDLWRLVQVGSPWRKWSPARQKGAPKLL